MVFPSSVMKTMKKSLDDLYEIYMEFFMLLFCTQALVKISPFFPGIFLIPEHPCNLNLLKQIKASLSCRLT